MNLVCCVVLYYITYLVVLRYLFGQLCVFIKLHILVVRMCHCVPVLIVWILVVAYIITCHTAFILLCLLSVCIYMPDDAQALHISIFTLRVGMHSTCVYTTLMYNSCHQHFKIIWPHKNYLTAIPVNFCVCPTNFIYLCACVQLRVKGCHMSKGQLHQRISHVICHSRNKKWCKDPHAVACIETTAMADMIVNFNSGALDGGNAIPDKYQITEYLKMPSLPYLKKYFF